MSQAWEVSEAICLLLVPRHDDSKEQHQQIKNDFCFFDLFGGFPALFSVPLGDHHLEKREKRQ